MFYLMTPVLLKIEHFFVPLSHCHPCRAEKWNNLPNVFYKDLINYIRFVFLRYFVFLHSSRQESDDNWDMRQGNSIRKRTIYFNWNCTAQQMREEWEMEKQRKKRHDVVNQEEDGRSRLTQRKTWKVQSLRWKRRATWRGGTFCPHFNLLRDALSERWTWNNSFSAKVWPLQRRRPTAALANNNISDTKSQINSSKVIIYILFFEPIKLISHPCRCCEANKIVIPIVAIISQNSHLTVKSMKMRYISFRAAVRKRGEKRSFFTLYRHTSNHHHEKWDEDEIQNKKLWRKASQHYGEKNECLMCVMRADFLVNMMLPFPYIKVVFSSRVLQGTFFEHICMLLPCPVKR